MPELPEVETVIRGVRPFLAGRVVERVRVLDWRAVRPEDPEAFCRRMEGRRFLDVGRKGKYLHFILDSVQMVSHLRMTGKFICLDSFPEKQEPHLRLDFLLSDGGVLLFQDTRRFGTNRLYAAGENPAEFVRLGRDPLSSGCTADYLAEAASGRSLSVKQFLLDQRIIAGLGNIYACEVLFAAGIDPEKKAALLSGREWGECVRETRRILKAAIRNNGTTIRDFRAVDEKTGEFQNFLQVYGREGEPCRSCGSPVRKIIQGGRGTWFCSRCQR